MATRIRLKRKKSGGNDGINLMPGEPYYNLADKKFYVGDDSTTEAVHIAKITEDTTVASNIVKFSVGGAADNVYTKTINNVEHANSANSADEADIAASLVLNTNFYGTEDPSSNEELTDAPVGSVYIQLENL